ncbi:hypothetical protein L0990_12570 [Vibrio kanaloae]|uniref:hypothetical protein n=1 Tax=Vibrio kanaloae TaxID=170673 RepID=UPI0035A6117B
MKGLLSIYVAISFVVAGYSIFTTSGPEGFGKNHVTEGLMWPMTVYEYVFEPEVEGGSIDTLIDSVFDIVESRESDYEKYLTAVSFNRIMLLEYVESQPSLTQTRVNELVKKSEKSSFGEEISLGSQSQSKLSDRLDGLNYEELVTLGKQSYQKVISIAQSRPMYVLGEDCVDNLISAFRKENGQDALIRYDMLQEFDEMCGL